MSCRCCNKPYHHHHEKHYEPANGNKANDLFKLFENELEGFKLDGLDLENLNFGSNKSYLIILLFLLCGGSNKESFGGFGLNRTHFIMLLVLLLSQKQDENLVGSGGYLLLLVILFLCRNGL